MRGNKVKQYRVVVTCGNDENALNNIMEVIDGFTEGKYEKATYQPLNERHPDILVIEMNVDDDLYHTIKCILMLLYPQTCAFDYEP